MINWYQGCFAGDCTYVHTMKNWKVYRLTYYNWCLGRNEVYWIPTSNFFRNSEFWNLNYNLSIFQQQNSKRKKPTRISRIKIGIGILLLMGVPEIGTKNWNSQPRSTSCPYYRRVPTMPWTRLMVSGDNRQHVLMSALWTQELYWMGACLYGWCCGELGAECWNLRRALGM